MGRKALGIRPWLDKSINVWHIRDGNKKISLGFGDDTHESRARAYAEVGKYTAEKDAGGRLHLTRQSTADITVADIISFYIDRRIQKFVPDAKYPNVLTRQDDVNYRLTVLLEFFGDTPLDALSVVKCIDFGKFVHNREIERKRSLYERQRNVYLRKLAAYEKRVKAREAFVASLIEQRNERVLPPLRSRPPKPLPEFNPANFPYRRSAARRYLEELAAAQTFAAHYEYIRNKVIIHLPPKYKGREHSFTMTDVRRMIKAAYYHKGMGWIDGKPVKDLWTRRHLARFIFLAITTGSRKDKIERVSFMNDGDGPWIDLWQERDPVTEAMVWKGRYHRLGRNEVEHAKKKAPDFPIPEIVVRRLLRWRNQGIMYPCAYPYHRSGKEEPGNLKDGMKTLFKELFGEDTEAVIHSFRHSAATWLCAQKDLPLPSVAAYLGMSTETLVKTYAKHREEDLQKIAAAVSDINRKGQGVHAEKLRETNPKHSGNVRQLSTGIDRMGLKRSA